MVRPTIYQRSRKCVGRTVSGALHESRVTSDTKVNKPTIYIDGQAGTTGLRIREMLGVREDIELALIPESQRKDRGARAEYLNRADVAILCLPDEAAEDALALVEGDDARVIDTSTKRRTDPGWVYGLPELAPEQREAIRGSSRVANPGCYPQSFVLAVRPLIEAGALSPDTPFTVNAVTGYSGGGRRMVEAYAAAAPASRARDAPIPLCLYGLESEHKHLPEMQQFSLANRAPLFVPSVDYTHCGMLVSVPLPGAVIDGLSREKVFEVWQARYRDEPFVQPIPPDESAARLRDGQFLDLAECGYTNRLELLVFGRPERGLVLVGRLDNLGKGASGNAVQCLNLMLGFDETTGLEE